MDEFTLSLTPPVPGTGMPPQIWGCLRLQPLSLAANSSPQPNLKRDVPVPTPAQARPSTVVQGGPPEPESQTVLAAPSRPPGQAPASRGAPKSPSGSGPRSASISTCKALGSRDPCSPQREGVESVIFLVRTSGSVMVDSHIGMKISSLKC